MTPRKFTPDEINAAINSAARQMTSAPSPSDLRARVMSRIDATPARSAWGWRFVFAGGAIASVAVVIAVRLASPNATAPIGVAVAPGVVSPNGLVSPKPKGEADPTAAPIASSPLLSTASVQRIAARSTTVEVSAAELEWRARSVKALAQPDALTVDPLESSRPDISPIDITPLSVAPVTVPAIGSNGSK